MWYSKKQTQRSLILFVQITCTSKQSLLHKANLSHTVLASPLFWKVHAQICTSQKTIGTNTKILREQNFPKQYQVTSWASPGRQGNTWLNHILFQGKIIMDTDFLKTMHLNISHPLPHSLPLTPDERLLSRKCVNLKYLCIRKTWCF